MIRPQPYLCCPRCSLVGPPERLDYTLGDDGGTDWDQPVWWQCAQCGHTCRITGDELLPDDGGHPCAGCGRPVACPADAARVKCGTCGLTGLGPGAADPEVAGHLRAVLGLHAIEVRVRAALPDQRQHPADVEAP